MAPMSGIELQKMLFRRRVFPLHSAQLRRSCWIQPTSDPMFTKLSDWRKRELGNRVPNTLRPENLSHFQALFRLYLRINACGHNQIRNVLMMRCTDAVPGRALRTGPGNV